MSLTATELRKRILGTRTTMLGAGPMSRTATNVVVELANRYRFPIALIPSRRQVDAQSLGGGYVEGWDTSSFAQYVRERDRGGFVLLARDHSGPWQGGGTPDAGSRAEQLKSAMDDVKTSLAADIEAGFDLIHIDPSPALARGYTETEVDELALELLDFCVEVGMRSGKVPIFEIGTDEQDMSPDVVVEARDRLQRMLASIETARLPAPLFYVLQTGTKVVETRNVGSFDQPFTMKGSLPATVHVPAVLDLCLNAGVLLKEHNADYLSDVSLKWHRKFGIHAANVAPEFGVRETIALLEVLSELELHHLIDEFGDLVLASGAWTKWMAPMSRASDRDKIRIAGHYLFAHPRVREIRNEASAVGKSKGINTEKRIENAVRASVERYLIAFGYGSGNV